MKWVLRIFRTVERHNCLPDLDGDARASRVSFGKAIACRTRRRLERSSVFLWRPLPCLFLKESSPLLSRQSMIPWIVERGSLKCLAIAEILWPCSYRSHILALWVAVVSRRLVLGATAI